MAQPRLLFSAVLSRPAAHPRRGDVALGSARRYATAMAKNGRQPANYARPSVIERLFGRALAAVVRLGVVRGHFYVLEVRGRSSGRTISLPVDLLELQGRQYLVCARGESQWVRNVRATGEIALIRTMRRRHYAVRELPAGERPPVLKAYLDRFAAEVQRFFSVPKGSPVASFATIADRHPVFELRLRDAGATTADEPKRPRSMQ